MITKKKKWIPYNRPQITRDDKRAVLVALDSGWIAGNGPLVAEFEETIAEYTGYKYALAVNSATSGLFAVCDLWSFDGSLPSLTFVATANMLKHYYIKDVDAQTLTLDEEFSVGVSYAGYPIKNAYIADDAHYLFPNMADWKTHRLSIISTHAVKPITTAEGGVILMNDESDYDYLSGLIDHGRSHRKGEFSFGFNFRMSEIQAALGLSQLKRASKNLAWRGQIADYYFERFDGNPYLQLPPNHERHSWHLFVLRTRNGLDRDLLRDKLYERGIGTQVHYPPLHLYRHLKPYVRDGEEFPVAMDVWQNGLSIPMFSDLSQKEMIYVADTINQVTEGLMEYS